MQQTHHRKRKKVIHNTITGAGTARSGIGTDTTSDGEKKYSSKELAALKGKSLNTIYNYIHRTKPALQCSYEGGEFQITLAQYDQFTAARTIAKLGKRGAK